MKKNKKRLINKPFIHDNLEFKNALLNYARELNGKGREAFEAQLVSAVIYAGIAEYLAGFLLASLEEFIYETTYNSSSAIAFIDIRNVSVWSPLNDLIRGLSQFEFPDKKEIIELLQDIKNCRNDLFHNLVKKNESDLQDIGNNIINIQNQTELLITKINMVNSGLQKVFYPEPPTEKQTDEAGGEKGNKNGTAS